MVNRRRRRSETLHLPAFAAVALEGRLTAAADDAGDDDGPVVIAGLAVPWDVTVQLNWWGDTVEFARGSLEVAHPGRVPFLLDHTNHPMGFGVSFTDTDAGLDATVAIPRDEMADADTARAVRQMGNGVRTALSIGAVIREADRTEGRDHDHYRVTAADLVELSSVIVPRFDDARIASIAAAAYTRNGVTMPGTATAGLPAFPARENAPLRLDDDVDEPDDVDDDDDEGDDGDAETSTSARPARGRATAGRPTTAGVPFQRRRPTARDTSLSAVCRRLAATGGDPRLVRAALNDVTTTDVPGLMRPQYVDELVGLLTIGTPAINAFRQGNLTSNPVVFPHWTTLPTVDKVTGGPPAEKVAIPTGDAVIGSLSFAVDTYAGGNDVSVQTIDWSSPAFLEAYFQAATEVYGRKIEQAYETGLLAWATSVGVIAPGTPIVEVLGAMLSAVAGKGFPGSLVVLVAGDVFGSLWVELAGGGPGIFSLVSADFPTPRIVPAPYLPAGTILTGMTGAAISFQNTGAPVRLRAVDVSLLGVDVGVYGYFAAGALYPAALLKATVPAAALAMPDGLDLLVGGDLLHGTPPALEPVATSKTAAKSA